MGGYKKIKPSDNPKPFNSPEGRKNINRNGRPHKKISDELQSQIDKNKYVVKIPKEFITHRFKNGAVNIVLPNREGIATRLLVLANSDQELVALRAISEILDRTEGNPKQSIDLETSVNIPKVKFVAPDPKHLVKN